jgi:uncharacterized protein (DUF2236 family)
LVDSALLFERMTIGRLDDADRQRFHEEQMLAAELCLVPRELIPPTVQELRSWLAGVAASGILQVTDGARRVADLFLYPPPEAEWRPVLRAVSRLAFGTLPGPLQRADGLPTTRARRASVRAGLAVARLVRPLLPPRYRFIAPYNEWRLRAKGRPLPEASVERSRRSVGIRL